MQANVFSIDKTHQHFILARHSFVSIRLQLNIRALICVYNRIGRTQLSNYLLSDSKVSGTIARKTDCLHVHVFGLRPVCAINFSRDQSSAKLINFRLETRDSILETRDSILEIIEDRVSRIEARGTVNLVLSGTVSPQWSYRPALDRRNCRPVQKQINPPNSPQHYCMS